MMFDASPEFSKNRNVIETTMRNELGETVNNQLKELKKWFIEK